MDLKDKLFEFLKSDKQVLLTENDKGICNKKHFTIVKIPYNSQIELLYMDTSYYNQISTDGKLEYCGFYNKSKDQLFDINYDLKRNYLELTWDDNSYKTMEQLLDEFNKKIRELITKYVNEYPKEFYDAASNYQSSIEERDIYEYIINGENNLKYESNYNSNDILNIFDYFEIGEEYLNQIAGNVIEERKEEIGKSLINIDRKNELINKVNLDVSNIIHKKKEIVDTIKDKEYGNVHVFINKNGIEFDFKYDASILSNRWDCSYISTYNMQAQDRKKFENLFGMHQDFHYEDIYKLEYRNKPIYIDNNFIKSSLEQTSDLAIN